VEVKAERYPVSKTFWLNGAPVERSVNRTTSGAGPDVTFAVKSATGAAGLTSVTVIVAPDVVLAIAKPPLSSMATFENPSVVEPAAFPRTSMVARTWPEEPGTSAVSLNAALMKTEFASILVQFVITTSVGKVTQLISAMPGVPKDAVSLKPAHPFGSESTMMGTLTVLLTIS
jgi:hypothetical protein